MTRGEKGAPLDDYVQQSGYYSGFGSVEAWLEQSEPVGSPSFDAQLESTLEEQKRAYEASAAHQHAKPARSDSVELPGMPRRSSAPVDTSALLDQFQPFFHPQTPDSSPLVHERVASGEPDCEGYQPTSYYQFSGQLSRDYQRSAEVSRLDGHVVLAPSRQRPGSAPTAAQQQQQRAAVALAASSSSERLNNLVSLY